MRPASERNRRKRSETDIFSWNLNENGGNVQVGEARGFAGIRERLYLWENGNNQARYESVCIKNDGDAGGGGGHRGDGRVRAEGGPRGGGHRHLLEPEFSIP